MTAVNIRRNITAVAAQEAAVVAEAVGAVEAVEAAEAVGAVGATEVEEAAVAEVETSDPQKNIANHH